jgi:hypothetical protein
MKRSLALVASAACIIWSNVSADGETVGRYWHNGSEMQVTQHDSTIIITYIMPRLGLPVLPGTVLFDGKEEGGNITGSARLYSATCDTLTYPVRGDGPVWRELFTLSGSVPIRGKNCSIVGYSRSGDNANLLFSTAEDPQ